MGNPYVRALLSSIRSRETFRFTSRSGDRVGSFVVGLDYVDGGWSARFDPLDKHGWRFHWIATSNRVTSPACLRA